ncbi:MAG: hypothetical protein PVG25_05865 [Anaerolineae bacterium]|jgi:hypothetical protein
MGRATILGGKAMSRGGFNESYNQYLILRGYDASSSKWVILKRALVDSWGEPGFHRFWRVWNPGVGHLLFRLYLLFGGNRIRSVSILLVFALCGIMHDALVMLMFRRPFAAFTAAFVLCGMLAVLNRSLEPVLHQERWPRWLNALINVWCLAVSIVAAVQLQMFFFP